MNETAMNQQIAHVGDENIEVQNVIESMESFRGGMDKPTFITFGTNAISPVELALSRPTKLGLVIWIQRDKLPDEMKGVEL